MRFHRLAIVNRGEPAMRVVHAAREYALEQAVDLRTIALYTDPDRTAMFVRQADEAHSLGPALISDAAGARRVAYLDYGILQSALTAVDADAVWVGWGLVAEHAAFVELCEDLGITFVGPSARVMRSLGDKIASKRIAESAGVPVAPWSGGPVDSIEEAHEAATRIGYPLLIKATAGGGGRGIRRVTSPDEMDGAFESARREAAGAFGDPTVFLEKLMPAARHIEVQVIGDGAGTVWPVGVRDCTVQRRNQKVIEEAPSPVLDAERHREVMDDATRLARAAGYENAGTVEFLYDPATHGFAFMEVNARLQVEHPITEVTTGLDLVKLQLHVAGGGRLEGTPPAHRGHAIEVRLNAEDPEREFAPAPGRIAMLRFAGGPGIRVDTGVEEGDDIAPQFDSMIAKVIVTGADRREAVARMRRALDQSAVVIEGGTTNKAFLQGLLERPEFHSGDYDIGWIDRLVAEGSHVPSRHAEPALLAAAITAYDEAVTVSIGAYTASAARGRPEVEGAIGHTVHLRHHGEPYAVTVHRLDPVTHRLAVDGHAIAVDLQRTGTAGRLGVAGTTHRFVSTAHAGTHVVEVDGIPHRFIHDEGGVIRAPSPAVVVAIPVVIGDRVEPGDRLAVVEAMKMETAIVSPVSGTVRDILVRTNQQVTTGDPLVTIDINANGSLLAGSGERLDFSRLASPDPTARHRGCRAGFTAIRRSLLGFDVDPADLAGRVQAGCCTDALDVDERRRLSDDVLTIFADVAGLFRRRPAEGEEEADQRRSFQEHLFDFLKDSTRRGEGLPPAFLEQLRRCLAHHGPEASEPGPRMESALFRLQIAHERMDRAVPVLLEVLEDRLEHPGHPGDEAFRSLLTRLIAETRHAYPALHDLAREVHYRTFDHPFLEGVRREAFAVVDDHLDHLQRDPECDDRAERIEALVACPQALAPRLAVRFVGAGPEVRRMLLEVMMRRYYRIRGLAGIGTADVDGLPVASARYERDGAMVHVVATRLEWDRRVEGLRLLSGTLARIDPDASAVVDVYVWRPDGVGDAAAIRTEIQQALITGLGHLEVRRVVVTVTGPTSAAEFGLGGVLHCTFRPDGAGGYREDTLYRDLHPMMAKRLELWRLENFDLTRLTTLEDIYLFHGVAKANPRDERLFAVAEVRDVTALRDEQGRITSIPELERVFHEVVGSMRRFQAKRPPDRRLVWNRILLYVWPEIEIDHQEIERMVERLAPDAAGIGLQKVVVLANLRAPDTGEVRRVVFEAANAREGTFRIRARRKAPEAIKPLSDYRQKVVRLRARGLTYPYELVRLLAPGKSGRDGFPPGSFVEYDLVDGRFEPVLRPHGENRSNVVVGLMTSHTVRYPDGMRRVAILGDPSRGMGNLAEPECARIIAALDLAEGLGVPVEWFAVSAGALIAMDSGTENMDWIARVLRRLVEFTQSGGEVNVVVCAINVGAQPYWNAEATMLMHTKGILVMTPEGAMVLTGKEALDYSGGVSAEDNQGIGGYERIMGPNGQAQYLAADLTEACRILLRHYEHSYVAPGERFPRRAHTSDPLERDVRPSPHGGEFPTVGDVLSDEHNPGRKKAFEIRRVMAAVIDQDHPPLERWFGMQGAEVAVVWDAHLGGIPVALIGLESKPMPRSGFVPADGPLTWTAGTLFPRSSKKVARAVNAASGSRPLVVLANLSGFDGSPESLRNLQLEYGAEIGRAVVNFDGPIVFCVVSRYHGGAFVVFSAALNDAMEVAAVEGSHASVIGGAPAAAVVFTREVARRVEADHRVRVLSAEIAADEGMGRAELMAQLLELREGVRTEKMGEVAAEFDAIHSVDRALRVGSVHRIIPPGDLRPYLVDAVERGMARFDRDPRA